MGRSWAASLLIGVLVSAALLALYHITEIFFFAALHTRDFYHTSFVLPPGNELHFVLPAQYAYYTIMAFVSAWVCQELPRTFSRLAFIAGAIFLTFLLSPALAFAGIIFEPLSGSAAILISGLSGMILGASEPGQRRHKLMHFFVGRLSTEKFQQL